MRGGSALTDETDTVNAAKELYLSVGGVLDGLTVAQREFILANLTIEDRLALGAEIRKRSRSTDPLLQDIIDQTLSKLASKTPDQIADDVIEQMERTNEEKARVERAHHMATLECRKYERTDLGNSKRLLERYGKDIRFCHPLDTWYIWNGSKWAVDEVGKIQALAKDTAIRIGDEAAVTNGDSERSLHYKWAGSSQQASKIAAMITLVKSDIPISPLLLDSKKNLLNCPNCTIDLDTFKKKPHEREDFCTKSTGVPFDINATCPEWERHLSLIFNNDQNRIRDFQQLAGYSLLAENPEQLFFIAHGGGCNGKGVTMNTLAYVLGDYCTSVSPETLMAQRNKAAGGDPRADLVNMIGARLILSSENERGTKLAEGLIKMMTGDDSLSFRGLYEKRTRTVQLTGKLWLSTNHMPRITGSDHAIWRRVCRVPFEVTIPEEHRDGLIKSKLQQEGSGVLNWLIHGLKMIRDSPTGRLSIPKWVRVATETYKKESDTFGQFLADKCVPKGEITKAALYTLYAAYCTDNGDEPLSKRSVVAIMRERGYSERESEGKRYWVGVQDRTVARL